MYGNNAYKQISIDYVLDNQLMLPLDPGDL